MESCFVLSIESEGEPSLVTFSVEGFLSDGQRMILRIPTATAIGKIVRSLLIADALDHRTCEAIGQLRGSYRLSIDLEEKAANRFVDTFKRTGSVHSPVQ